MALTYSNSNIPYLSVVESVLLFEVINSGYRSTLQPNSQKGKCIKMESPFYKKRHNYTYLTQQQQRSSTRSNRKHTKAPVAVAIRSMCDFLEHSLQPAGICCMLVLVGGECSHHCAIPAPHQGLNGLFRVLHSKGTDRSATLGTMLTL